MSSRLRILPGEADKSPPSVEPISQEQRPFQGKVALVNLGCAKNQVDSEVMMGALQSSGFHLVDDPEEADIAVVNTCGFLQPAVEEGVDTILDLSDLKSGRLRKLIVAGCMVERYGESLKESLPEVDHFLTGNDLLEVVRAAKDGYESPLTDGARPYFLYDDSLPRALSSGNVSAYVKISEGCDRPCAFCIIPRIRGSFRSRDAASIIREVNALSAQGVKEVNLVAQDLTAYGADNPGKDGKGNAPFLALLEKLDRETRIPWIRLFYAYPLGVTPELLKTIAQSQRIVNYLDIPLQHVSESVLRSMRRPLGKCAPRPLVSMMRETAPEVAIRTTFIVGHPGETEDDISDLADFLREVSFEHVGIFTYSREEGTPSHDLEKQIPEEEKARRRDYLMEIQQEVQLEKLERLLGSEQKVLLEGYHADSDLLLRGRMSWQGPEVDGEVIINELAENLDLKSCEAGTFVKVNITEVAGYDLVGTGLEIL